MVSNYRMLMLSTFLAITIGQRIAQTEMKPKRLYTPVRLVPQIGAILSEQNRPPLIHCPSLIFDRSIGGRRDGSKQSTPLKVNTYLTVILGKIRIVTRIAHPYYLLSIYPSSPRRS
jgi:hypothetical protein